MGTSDLFDSQLDLVLMLAHVGDVPAELVFSAHHAALLSDPPRRLDGRLRRRRMIQREIRACIRYAEYFKQVFFLLQAVQ
jgi:hypothetical protein